MEALAVSTEAFSGFLREYPRGTVVLLRTLSRHVRDSTRRLIVYGALDTTGRVAARLVKLADRYGETSGGRVLIPLRLTQEELAGWVGASREAVSKALRVLRERGWIETRRRGFIILDRDALRAYR